MKRLLIDENLSASLATLLPVDCCHATELGQQPTDSLLWNHARERNWTILTRDTDFFDRIMLQGPPPKVIWVRLGNMANEPLDHPSNWPTPLPPVQNLKTEEFLQEHAELAEELRAAPILFPSMFAFRV